jgi:hypothetical protein
MAKKATTTRSKANDGAAIIRANVNREAAPSANFVSLYVNYTQVQVTPWDVRFMLGVIDGVPSPENPTVLIKQIGEIRMSPQHAKKVAQVLVNQIANYEKNIGPIVLPQD